MMNFKSMTNKVFETQFQAAVDRERKITVEVLHFFREAERRMLYAERGRKSLLEYAVLDLKYSEPAAHRRISAMRAIRDMPEIEEKISSGALNLSTVNQAQTVIRQNEKALGQKATADEKREILEKIEGLSFEKSKRALAEACPAVHPEVQEKVKPSANGTFKLETTLSPELYAVLEEIQDLEGRRIEIKELLLEMAIERRDKLRKKRGVVVAVSLATATNFTASTPAAQKTGASTSVATPPSESAAFSSTTSKIRVSTLAASTLTLAKSDSNSNSNSNSDANSDSNSDFNSDSDSNSDSNSNSDSDSNSNSDSNSEFNSSSSSSIVRDGHTEDSSAYQSSMKSTGVAMLLDETKFDSTDFMNSANGPTAAIESSSSKRKYISVKIDRANRARAGHQCEYTDPETGVRCSARRHLETEHKISVAHGGDDSLENLQLYCATHNKLKAAQQLGFDFMAEFIPSLH